MAEYTDKKTKNITNPVVTDYVESLYSNAKFDDFRAECEEKGIPIITKETEAFLACELAVIQPKKILEIGCAVGYSAMFFTEQTGAEIYTVEKDENTFEIARKNVETFGYKDKIHIYLGDGEEVIESLGAQGIQGFDLVFIDAAKSHYKRFFDAALKLVNPGALIIGDNVLFQAKVASDEYDKGGKHKTNIRKLREFNEYISNDPRFQTAILAVGDGISLTKVL